ncbi:MAG: sel1 repeat family protein [Alphaproteobacteria bacterium]|nr:sel1 repeat family protein [Alphaproteobacteria bacterium]
MKTLKIFILTLLFLSLAEKATADYTSALEAFQSRHYTEAIEELKEPLKENDPRADYLMGYLCYQGLGIPQSDSKAVYYFKMAADQDYPEAQTFLAYLYDEGRGVPQDKRKAFDLYQKCSERGDITATINLGVMYYKGDAVPQNYSKSFDLLHNIEEYNSKVLQLYLGNFYYYGNGVKQNTGKAVKYYLRAAELGSIEAHYLLAHIISTEDFPEKLFGRPMPPASELYLYAAQMGYPVAQFNLGSMHMKENPPNPEKAYAWFSLAADNGDTRAEDALFNLDESLSLDQLSVANDYLLELKKIDVSALKSPIRPISTKKIEEEVPKKRPPRSNRMLKRR